MDESAITALETELAPGEQLLWAGQPSRGLRIFFPDLFFMFFGLTLLTVLIVPIAYISDTLAAGDPLDFGNLLSMLISISPFVLVGLYLLIGRLIVDIYRRRQTFYGITDKRALLVSGLFRRQSQAINLRNLTQVSYQEKRRGHGTIFFGESHSFFSMPPNLNWPGIPKPAPSFDSIPDARRVYELVRDIQLG